MKNFTRSLPLLLSLPNGFVHDSILLQTNIYNIHNKHPHCKLEQGNQGIYHENLSLMTAENNYTFYLSSLDVS